MTFERLVRDKNFASELTTTAVGRLDLERPTKVVIANARLSVDTTAELLAAAHERAVLGGAATMVYGLAVPFVGFEGDEATDVKPDFAVVAPQVPEGGGKFSESWLVVGDAKDYERVRSRIDDRRLLKGFLQVALGAESVAQWSRLPAGMTVHPYGALAVPRNAFLQPEALVELLDDHRAEVRMRVEERRREAADTDYDPGSAPIDGYVTHLEATFDPEACASCTLYSFCRDELRNSATPTDLLIEIGVPPALRPGLEGLVDGSGLPDVTPGSIEARVRATVEGVGQSTSQARVDQAGQPGTVNVVLAKSDSAALGVHGIATQRVTADGPGDWRVQVFDDPLGSETRREIMKILGADLTAVMKDRRSANKDEPSPVHLVVPDGATGDLLTSMADNLAGIELSRLRWSRDKEMGRPALTFNGAKAQLPRALPERARTAVSFLLEEDRARALSLRSPIVDLRAALARHVVAGGAEVNSLRLDYLVAWADASGESSLDHRDLTDEIEAQEHTPGARMTNRRSDAIHRAFVGEDGSERPAEPAKYDALTRDELEYKCRIVERALDALQGFPDSKLREVYRAIEGDSQVVWRRRLALHASDLVRFGRTYRHWRNSLVPTIEADSTCAAQLLALTNPQTALDSAADAGSREIATARVIEADPLTIEVDSRRIGDESRIVLLHVGDRACVESGAIEVKFQKGSFKLSGLSIGPLEVAEESPGHLVWEPAIDPGLAVGDELVVANFEWFADLKGNKALPISRPRADMTSAPKEDCSPEAYAEDPEAHQYCCRPHEVGEAVWSDKLAERRANGELNPETWPPVVDSDGFEVAGGGAPVGDPTQGPAERTPDSVTADDLD